MKELIRPLFLRKRFLISMKSFVSQNQFSIYKKFFAPQKPILDFHEVLCFSKTNSLFILR